MLRLGTQYQICVMFYQEFLKEVSINLCYLLFLSMIYLNILNLQSLLSLIADDIKCLCEIRSTDGTEKLLCSMQISIMVLHQSCF